MLDMLRGAGALIGVFGIFFTALSGTAGVVCTRRLLDARRAARTGLTAEARVLGGWSAVRPVPDEGAWAGGWRGVGRADDVGADPAVTGDGDGVGRSPARMAARAPARTAAQAPARTAARTAARTGVAPRHPILGFTTSEGREVRLEDPSLRSRTVGETVTVRYQPHRPELAVPTDVTRSEWVAAGAAIAGLGCCVVAGITLVVVDFTTDLFG